MELDPIAALKFFFEMEDAKQAIHGNYRVTASNQAIYDGVYFNPAFRLAELLSKPASSLRYRAVSAAFDMEATRELVFKIINEHSFESMEAIKEIGWEIHVDRPYGGDDSDVETYIQINPLVGTGAGFCKIEVNNYNLYFFYPWELYDDIRMPLPQGLYDLQCFQDIVKVLERVKATYDKEEQ